MYCSGAGGLLQSLGELGGAYLAASAQTVGDLLGLPDAQGRQSEAAPAPAGASHGNGGGRTDGLGPPEATGGAVGSGDADEASADGGLLGRRGSRLRASSSWGPFSDSCPEADGASCHSATRAIAHNSSGVLSCSAEPPGPAAGVQARGSFRGDATAQPVSTPVSPPTSPFESASRAAAEEEGPPGGGGGPRPDPAQGGRGGAGRRAGPPHHRRGPSSLPEADSVTSWGSFRDSEVPAEAPAPASHPADAGSLIRLSRHADQHPGALHEHHTATAASTASGALDFGGDLLSSGGNALAAPAAGAQGQCFSPGCLLPAGSAVSAPGPLHAPDGASIGGISPAHSWQAGDDGVIPAPAACSALDPFSRRLALTGPAAQLAMRREGSCQAAAGRLEDGSETGGVMGQRAGGGAGKRSFSQWEQEQLAKFAVSRPCAQHTTSYKAPAPSRK